MNEYYCIQGYSRYIKEAYDEARTNGYNNPDNLITTLIATIFPEVWARKMFVKWLAKIINALYTKQ